MPVPARPRPVAVLGLTVAVGLAGALLAGLPVAATAQELPRRHQVLIEAAQRVDRLIDQDFRAALLAVELAPAGDLDAAAGLQAVLARLAAAVRAERRAKASAERGDPARLSRDEELALLMQSQLLDAEGLFDGDGDETSPAVIAGAMDRHGLGGDEPEEDDDTVLRVIRDRLDQVSAEVAAEARARRPGIIAQLGGVEQAIAESQTAYAQARADDSEAGAQAAFQRLVALAKQRSGIAWAWRRHLQDRTEQLGDAPGPDGLRRLRNLAWTDPDAALALAGHSAGLAAQLRELAGQAVQLAGVVDRIAGGATAEGGELRAQGRSDERSAARYDEDAAAYRAAAEALDALPAGAGLRDRRAATWMAEIATRHELTTAALTAARAQLAEADDQGATDGPKADQVADLEERLGQLDAELVRARTAMELATGSRVTGSTAAQGTDQLPPGLSPGEIAARRALDAILGGSLPGAMVERALATSDWQPRLRAVIEQLGADIERLAWEEKRARDLVAPSDETDLARALEVKERVIDVERRVPRLVLDRLASDARLLGIRSRSARAGVARPPRGSSPTEQRARLRRVAGARRELGAMAAGWLERHAASVEQALLELDPAGRSEAWEAEEHGLAVGELATAALEVARLLDDLSGEGADTETTERATTAARLGLDLTERAATGQVYALLLRRLGPDPDPAAVEAAKAQAARAGRLDRLRQAAVVQQRLAGRDPDARANLRLMERQLAEDEAGLARQGGDPRPRRDEDEGLQPLAAVPPVTPDTGGGGAAATAQDTRTTGREPRPPLPPPGDGDDTTLLATAPAAAAQAAPPFAVPPVAALAVPPVAALAVPPGSAATGELTGQQWEPVEGPPTAEAAALTLTPGGAVLLPRLGGAVGTGTGTVAELLKAAGDVSP